MKTRFALLALLAPLFPTLALAVAGPWINAIQQGDKAYFLYAAAPRIEVFDFTDSSWESPITLEKAPSQFHIDDAYLYVAYGKALYRYTTDGSNETHVANFLHPVVSIHSDGEVLIVNHSQNNTYFDTFNRQTFDKLDSLTTGYRFGAATAHDSEGNKIYGSYSSNHAITFGYEDDGSLDDSLSSYYSYDQPLGEQVFSWPGTGKYVGTWGWVFLASDHTPLARLTPEIRDISFLGGSLPIALSGDKLVSYSRTYKETGSATLATAGAKLFLHADDAFVFRVESESSNGIGFESVPLSDLTPDDPDAPIDPATLAFTPDQVFADKNGSLFLFARNLGLLCRWDVESQSWLDSLSLKSIPLSTAYSAENDRIYVSYKQGEITQIDPAAETLSEVDFLEIGSQIREAIPTGAFLLVALFEGGSHFFKIYDSSGSEIDSTNGDYQERTGVWNPSARRFVHRRNYYSSYLYDLVVQENGEFGALSGGSVDGGLAEAPLYSHPSQSLVLTTNGIFYNPTARESESLLPESVRDASWVNDEIYTLHDGALKNWTLPTYGAGDTLEFSAQPIALERSGDKLLLTTLLSNGFPNITVLSTDFSVVPPATLQAPVISLGKKVASAIGVAWTPVSGAQNFHIERSIDGSTWEEIGTASFERSSFADPEIEIGRQYHYRAKAVNGELASAYSNTLVVDTTLEPNDLPAVAPSEIQSNLRSSFTDSRDVLYLTFQNVASILRYDLVAQKWLDSIPTRDVPNSIAFSPQRDSVFTGYPNGKVYEINLRGGPLQEVEFATTPEDVNAIITTEDRVILANYYTQSVYDPAGYLLSEQSVSEVYAGAELFWDPTTSRYYWSRYRSLTAAGLSPRDTITTESASTNESGSLVAAGLDSSLLLANSGKLYSMTTLASVNNLATPIIDGVWIDGRLFTANGSNLSEWQLPTYSPGEQYSASLPIRRLESTTAGQIVLIASENQKTPRIDILSLDFELVAPETLAAPPQPRLSHPSASAIHLKWDDVGGETGYVIERKTAEGVWEELGATDSNDTQYTDIDIETGTSYSYRFKAKNGDAESAYSELLEISGEAPSPVTNLVATTDANSNVTLSWEIADSAMGYRVVYSQGSNNFSDYSEMLAPSTDSFTSYIYPGNLYHFRIASYNAYNQIAHSNTVSAYVDLAAPPSPYSINATPTGPHTAQISWSGGYQNVEFYRLERADLDGDNEWTLVEEIDSNNFQFVDTRLEPASRYRYRVAGVNPVGSSSFATSEVIETEELVTPSKPSIAAGQVSSESVLISWSPLEEVESYSLLRRSNGDDEWETLRVFESDESSYTDSDVELGDLHSYTLIATNAAGSSPQADEQILWIQETETLFDYDFEAGLGTENFGSISSGTIATSDTPGIGQYLDLIYYRQVVVLHPLDLRSGGVFKFSIKFIGSANLAEENTFSLRYRVDQQDFEIAKFKSSQALAGQWQTFAVTLPEGAQKANSQIVFLHAQGNQWENRFGLDNLEVKRFIPAAPAAPLSVVAKSSPDGGVAVFWIPSLHATSYVVEHSLDGGETWAEVTEQIAPISHYLESSPFNEESIYRVSAKNSGGSSEPTLSNAAASDVELADAVQLGIDKVVATPDTYGLYGPTEYEAARIAGQQEVQADPARFGLFLEETISQLYFHLNEQPAEIQGNLLTLPWILRRSADMVNWTEHLFELEFDLEQEASDQPLLIKIAPQAAPAEK